MYRWLRRIYCIGDNKYVAKISIKLGPVNASFRSTIEINNIIEEVSYEIEAQGNAGQLGNASGKIKVFLKEFDNKQFLIIMQILE